jgi:hypothetical protein
MPTSYTSLLGLALPVTGELSGTWGDTVNDYITRYVDASVAGTQIISGSQTAVTLTVTNGTTLTQVGSGSSGSAQYAVINCTGNPAGLLTITAPASSRQYLIINATSTSQSVKIVGAGPTTGVTMVTGESAIVAWNGSDYVKVASSTADGVTTFSAGTTGFTPSTATSGAVTLAGTLATTNGGTGLTSFTANGIVYASSSSALTTGSALTFDGAALNITPVSGNATSVLTGVSTSGAFTNYKNSTADHYVGANNNAASLFSGIGGANSLVIAAYGNLPIGFGINGSEQMRLTSTGLGIGTSSPNAKLTVGDSSGAVLGIPTTATFYGTSSISSSVGTVGLFSTETAAADVGPVLTFGGKSGNSFSPYPFAFIQGAKASATAGDYSGYLRFFTVPSDGSGPVERLRINASGNLGLGVTPSAWESSMRVLQVANTALYNNGLNDTFLGANFYNDTGGTNRYINSDFAAAYGQVGGAHQWYTAPSGTAGNAISFTQAMTLDASGNLLLGTTSATPANANGVIAFGGTDAGIIYLQRQTGTDQLRFYTGGNRLGYVNTASSILTLGTANFPLVFATNDTERARITAAGFTQPVAYADTVSALGNTGTATTINLLNANVFTATLTGNCTFTLSNPIATGSSSFTLILTNDGTAGRTVAWAGGSFVFPGGAAALSRTTTANAVDVWVFFTPNGGTTWYGNIAMKDMKA